MNYGNGIDGDGDDAWSDGGRELRGVYGAAGDGGRVVTATLELVEDEGVFAAEYVPFVAGVHRLNVTHQVTESLQRRDDKRE